MNALLRGEPLPLVDGGAQRRAFMDVTDMTDAVCRVLERPKASDGQIFNLGNPDNDVSIADLARQVAEIFERSAPRAPKARFEHVTAEDFYGPGYADTDERIPDVSKARRLLGWSPRCSLADMLPGIVIDYIERYSERVAAAAPLGLSKLASSA
jgi:UDP-apiose/xylose synthase